MERLMVLRRVLATALVAVAMTGALAGCGETGATGTPPDPAAAEQADVRVVESEEDAPLHLYVSNQSFVDETVGMTVTIDGVEVVADDFEVEGQHTWILFPVDLEPGEHELVVRSSTGAELTRTITTPETGRRYAVAEYWRSSDAEDPTVSWRMQKQPLAFA